MVTKLNCSVKSFTHIVHVADIHCRLLSRLEEYSEIFSKLYGEIKKTPDDTLICLVGDILHNKVTISPECVQLSANFLFNCAELRPTVLIAGNHDGLTQNINRLDSLSPIVNTLNHPNLYYLKQSGLYSIGDILFSVCGVFDENKFINYDLIPKIYKNEYKHHIALYHGIVDGVTSDTGFILNNVNVKKETFDGFHVVLLGDIHRHQDLQNYNYKESKPIIRYCGSLISQNFTEENYDNGFSMWDLNRKTYNHINIPNDYGFFTVKVDKGNIITDLTNIPKKSTIRIDYTDCDITEVKSVISKLKSVSCVNEVSYTKIKSDSIISTQPNNIKISDISDVTYQNTLITDILKTKYEIKDQTVIDDVLSINIKLNNEIDKTKLSKNIKWNLKKFEFSNLFSYGDDNTIDFTKMSGLMGLFSGNKTGKTSIFESLCYCLFDKTPRSHKAGFILNSQKTSFKCKLNFDINGVDYFIERKGVSDKKGNVKVDVRFWKEENGKQTDLKGEARQNTNDIIRDYIGTYDDFIMTTLSTQNIKNASSFIDMTQSERKDLLSQFIGLNIFDNLLEIAMDKSKDIFSTIKAYKKDDNTTNLQNFTNEFESLNCIFNDETNQLSKLNDNRNVLSNDILEETKKLKHISCEVIDVKQITLDISSKTSELNKNKNNKTNVDNIIDELIKSLKLNDNKLESLESKDVSTVYKKYLRLNNEYTTLLHKLDVKKIEIKNKLDKKKMLDKHEYDPNCKFCVNNEFVKDAIKLSKDLEVDKIDGKKMVESICELKQSISNIEWVIKENDECNVLMEFKHKTNGELSTQATYRRNVELMIPKLESEIDILNNKVKQYNDQITSIQYNKTIQITIDKLKLDLKNMDFNINQKNKKLTEIYSKLSLLKNRIQQLTDIIDNVKLLEKSYETYSLYIKSVNRDGLPYTIISNVVPELQTQINNILNQIVDFQLVIETDGKNISPYISYDDKKWPVEMVSGFEKFITALAIRISLISISNLPKTGVLFQDEGFGVIDSNNMVFVKPLLDYLKSMFSFIIVISHLNDLKDCVDKHIEIKFDNGFSKVEYI